MRHTLSAVRTWVFLLVWLVLGTERGVAQVASVDSAGIIVGASVGRLYEAWEDGQKGSAAVWTVLLGYQFNPKWTLRGEVGPGYDMCDKRVNSCHRHSFLLSMSMARSLPASTYILFGPIHFGLGVKVPMGARLAASGEVVFGLFDARWDTGIRTKEPW